MVNEKDKKLLLKTINKKGFILEDRTWKILHDFVSGTGRIARGLIPRNFVYAENERAEIDVLAVRGIKQYIVECKHTDYSWIFPKSFNRQNNLSLIHGFSNEGKLVVNSRPTSDFRIVFNDLCILFNEDGSVKKEGRSEFAQTSYRDAHEAVRQVLKNLKAYLLDVGDFRNKFFIPIIVTNADLYYLDYEEKDIDPKGDFIDFKHLEKVPYLVYNFSEILGEPFTNDEAQMKSVFIVNVNSLIEAIKLIEDQDLAGNIPRGPVKI